MKLLAIAKRMYEKMLEGKSINPYEYRAVLGEAIQTHKTGESQKAGKTMKKSYFKELGEIAAQGLPSNKIDFRKNGVQAVNLPFDGEQKITFVGRCPVTGVRLYESTGSNDPRGPLGVHAVEVFEASGFDMTGPDLLASWIACNNDQRVYNRALEIAKKSWTAV